MEFVDQEVSVLNESTKRVCPDVSNGGEKKPAKKRRSSLATTRRSITGSIAPHSSGGKCVSLTSNQMSNEWHSDGQPVMTKRLKSNPANVHMDEIISKFHTKIKALDQEYDQWKEALQFWNEQDKHTKFLSESACQLSDQDIPDEIKNMAKNFITCPLMDFTAMEKEVDQRLQHVYINMTSCMRDVHLFRETVRGLETANQLKRIEMSPHMAEVDEIEFERAAFDDLIRERNDLKCDIENLINNE